VLRPMRLHVVAAVEATAAAGWAVVTSARDEWRPLRRQSRAAALRELSRLGSAVGADDHVGGPGGFRLKIVEAPTPGVPSAR
jgi:hypothetical protein